MNDNPGRDVGEDVAMEVMHHIREMYPAMFAVVAANAQTSVRNCIVVQCERYVKAHGLIRAPRDLTK